MKITMLGTGHAMVNNCFNTCFIMEDNDRAMLVDTGGGYEILPQIARACYRLENIHDIFISHKHTDHITGISWILRSFISRTKKNPDTLSRIYGNRDVMNLVSTLAELQFEDSVTSLLGRNLFFITVEDGQKADILDNEVTFFDTHARKVTQYGFIMKDHKDDRYVFCGDEPLAEENFHLAEGCKLLMHESFCMERDAYIFNPHHAKNSTVMEACQTAEKIKAENILIYHTEDRHMDVRKRDYTEEGRDYFSGGIFVPDDLERIDF